MNLDIDICRAVWKSSTRHLQNLGHKRWRAARQDEREQPSFESGSDGRTGWLHNQKNMTNKSRDVKVAVACGGDMVTTAAHDRKDLCDLNRLIRDSELRFSMLRCTNEDVQEI